MIVKDATDGSSNRVSLGLTCKSCMHLTGTKTFEKVCSQLGMTSFSNACPSFTPDYARMKFVKQGDLQTFADIVNRQTKESGQLLAYSVNSADLVKRLGFLYGEEVVFSLGGDYLECYFRGLIIGADRKGTQVYITSKLEGLNKGDALITLLRSSVMSMPDFAKKRKQLIAEGRIAEPKYPKASRKRSMIQTLTMTPDERAVHRERISTKVDSYVPPSIDTVPATWLDNRMRDTPVGKKGVTAAAKKTGKVASDGKSFSLNRHGDKTPTGSRAKAKPKVVKATKR